MAWVYSCCRLQRDCEEECWIMKIIEEAKAENGALSRRP